MKNWVQSLHKLRNNSQSITNSGISQITNNLKSSFSDIQNQVKEYDKLAYIPGCPSLIPFSTNFLMRS